MTTHCAQCGSRMTPGQPVCTDCGTPAPSPSPPPQEGGPSRPEPVPETPPASPPSSTPAAAGSSESTKKPAAPRRDKKKDFARVGSVVAEKYKVLDVLGQGGFGTVYLVEITAGMVGEKLALKILPEELSGESTFRTQFLNEIRVAMRLVDRSIVQIRDVGTTPDGLLYYTMDYCPGITLAQILRREGRLPVTRSLVLILNVLRALQTAHAAGIIHRDLKPANIMVEEIGGKEAVRVLDFGIATAVTPSGEKSAGQGRGFAGSPSYMPPEQFVGAEVGFYSDLYSIGVVLYECITGQRPHVGATPQEVFRSLKTKPVPPPEEIVAEVNAFPGLSELILKCLERNPERRIQSAKELFDQVNSILLAGTTIESKAAAPPPQRRRTGPPRRAPAARRPAPRAPASRPVAPPPETTARAAERIRRQRGPVATRRPRLRVWSVALATLIVGGVVVGVLFHKDLKSFFARLQGDGVETPGGGAVPKRDDQDPKGGGAQPQPQQKTKNLKTAQDDARKHYLERLLKESSEALEAGNTGDALESAEKAVELDPKSGAAHRLRGLAALREGKLSDAATSLEKARELLATEEVDKVLLRSLVRAWAGLPPPHLEKAEALAVEIAGEHPKDGEALGLLAVVLEKAGKTDRVKQLLLAAKKQGVESPDLARLYDQYFLAEIRERKQRAEELLGQAREAMGRRAYREGADLAGQSASLVPSVEADLVRLDGLIETASHEEAAQYVKEALTRANYASEDSPPAQESVARVAAFGDYLAAIEALEAAEAADQPATRGTKLTLAESSLSRALEGLSGKSTTPPERLHLRVRLELAHAQALRGELVALDRMLGPLVASKDPVALLRAPRLYFEAARASTEEKVAIEAYGKAKRAAAEVVRDKTLPGKERDLAVYRRGLCDLALGDLTGTESYYRQALDHFSTTESSGQISPELYESWSRAYTAVGNLIRAAQCLRRAYEVEPSAERGARAVAAYRQANPASREARELLEECRLRFPDDPALKGR